MGAALHGPTGRNVGLSSRLVEIVRVAQRNKLGYVVAENTYNQGTVQDFRVLSFPVFSAKLGNRTTGQPPDESRRPRGDNNTTSKWISRDDVRGSTGRD